MTEVFRIEKGIISIIGSGGKSSLIEALAGELCQRGSVIITTSTHMLPVESVPLLTGADKEGVREALGRSSVLQVCEYADARKLKGALLSPEELSTLADYVLVEADGSRMQPIKAHASHEPAIPPGNGKTICVIGAGGFGKPLEQVCHRPEIFARKLQEAGMGCDTLSDPVTPEAAAAVAGLEALAEMYFVNRVETETDLEAARQFAKALREILGKQMPVIVGSVQKGEYQCL